MTITSGLGCAKTVDGNSIHFIFVENSLSHWSLKSPTAAWYVYIYSLIIFVHVFFYFKWPAQPTNQASMSSIRPIHPGELPDSEDCFEPPTKDKIAGSNHKPWAPAMTTTRKSTCAKPADFCFAQLCGVLWFWRCWLDETVNLAVYLQPFSKLKDHQQKWWVSPVRCSFSFSRGPFSGAISVFGGVAAFLWWIWKFGHVILCMTSETLDMSWIFRPFGRFCFSAASRILHSNDPLRDVRFFLRRIALVTFPTNWTPGDFRCSSLYGGGKLHPTIFHPTIFWLVINP